MDRLVFPPLYQIREESKKARPNLEIFENGVKAKLFDCLQNTLEETLQEVDLTGLEPDQLKNLQFDLNYGLDGSGSHQNFNQMDKKHFSTTSIISVCFGIKEIRSGDIILYKPESANKPCLVRPWMLFPGIELDPLLRKVTILMEQEIDHVKQNRIQFSVNGKDVEPTLEKVNMSMIDGKIIIKLLQLAGAYCTMCEISGKEAHKAENISAGFLITRTVENITELALVLADTDGDIRSWNGNYETRKGITGK